MKKTINKIKNNKLNIFTITFGIAFIIVYVVSLVILIINKYSIKSILALSADYVTIVSCILILIQLIAYVKDSRRNEFRSRKEAAYNIAKEYAENVISKMTYIQSVLAVSYNKEDPYELEKTISNARITSFLNQEMRNHQAYARYVEEFMDLNKDAFQYDVIINLAIANQISGFDDLISIEKNEIKSHLSNNRFISMLMNTLNILEYFAMSVNQNVSDSEMLYASLHQTFLKFVIYVYPFICFQNVDEELYYPNIITLYYTWNETKTNTEHIKRDLEKKKQKKLQKNKNSGKPL